MSEQGERLQKVMAHAGVGSRRACEEIIEQGRVTIDGKLVTRLGTRVRADQLIRVDGERVTFDESKVTMALHKPAGIVSTMEDEMGRPSLAQFIEDRTERLYHVGRLDQETEGLILLSNDGDLTHRLTHPSYEIPKTYVATVEGQVNRTLQRRLENGINLEEGLVKADSVKIIEMGLPNSIVEITLHSGANHVVRRLFETAGFPVVRLVRTQFGSISLGRLKPGRSRIIGGSELGALMKSVDL